MGVGRGSVVAIRHSGTARFFADLFATWSVGAAAACLDSTLTSGELQNVVDFANSAMLLVDGGTAVDNFSVPVVELAGARPRSSSAVTPTINLDDDPALLLFTSGTTGTPKGVVLTFGCLSARINANITAIGAGVLARALVTLPTYFGHGLIGNSLTPLLAGGKIVLHPRGMPLINDLGRIIDEHGISFMSSVPSLWRLALTCSPQPVGRSLLRIHVGSAPLSPALWSEVAAWSGAEVVNCYGITETANWIAGASSRKDGIAEGLVGQMWGGSAAVMDESGSIRNEGAGEIVIKSSCLMSGYFKRPDLTAAAFSQGWFRTGDQGLIDEHSRIWVTGRIKDEINRGGFKVQPAEIDSLLERHPAVAEACVFGIPDPMGGEAIAAAIRLANGENATPLSLQSWCSQRLRRAAVPEHWFFVSEIPRTARGKVSRDVVRRMLTQDTNASTPKAEPERPTSAAVAIAATFTSDPLIPALRFALQEAGLSLDVRAAPYHQLLQELLSSTSLLATNAGGIDVVVIRFEDFVRDVENIKDARIIIRQTASELQNALGDHAQRAKVPTLLAVLAPSPRAPKALLPDIDAENEKLFSYARSLPGLSLVSQEDIDLVSSGERYDEIGDAFTHTPFTEEHYASLAVAIVRKVLALRAPGETLAHTLVSGHSLLQALRARGVLSRTLPGSREMPATDTERRLLGLWEEILGIEGLGVEDDYFALGGTSLMAARLFAEVSRRFAVKMPLTAILEAPTVRALSRHLEQDRTSPARTLIELRRGGPRSLFFVHDGIGETLLYLNLARRMPNDLAVIGIEPRRIPGVPLAHTRIEDMAAFYIEEVRKKQPHGPYLLAGMCAGGVIAYEMASQLVDVGEGVELVALLDAVTPQAPKRVAPITKHRSGRSKKFLEFFQKCELTPAERIKAVAHVIYRKIANALSREIARSSDILFLRARLNLLRDLLSRDAAWPSFVPELGFQEILNSAQACYVPKPLSISSIVLARATSGEAFDIPYLKLYADETLGWDVVAQNLTVIDVDGGHESMLREPFVESLARALMPYVQQKPVQANNTRVRKLAEA
jgi:acyl-CoA synthetase (AMP-forming)/AMP-acid ligase II/thioesterase domain-containing protein/acyl carrier protein